MFHSGSKCLDLFYHAKQQQKEKKLRDISTEEKDFLSSKKDLTFRPDLSLTRSQETKECFMNMIVEKVGEIKGTKDIINRLRVGRTLKEYEIESRRHGVHVNDGGVGLLKEISKKYKAELPNKMKKAYEPTRPSATEYSPTKSFNTFGNNDPVNIVTNFSPQTKGNLMRWSKSNSPLK